MAGLIKKKLKLKNHGHAQRLTILIRYNVIYTYSHLGKRGNDQS